MMKGGAGDDAYIVENAGDVAIENGGDGNDTVFSTANFALSANVENLMLQGAAALAGLRQRRSQCDPRQYWQQPDRRRRRRRHDARWLRRRFYFVDNAGDNVIESAGQGKDTVLSSVSFMLSRRRRQPRRPAQADTGRVPIAATRASDRR